MQEDTSYHYLGTIVKYLCGILDYLPTCGKYLAFVSSQDNQIKSS